MTATFEKPVGSGSGAPEADPVASAALAAHIADSPAHGGDVAGTPRPPTAHGHSTGDITGLDAALAIKANSADVATDAELVAAITAHEADTTDVHGIADTAALTLNSDARLSDQRVPTNSSVTDAKVAAGAAIAQSKISGLTASLAAKQDTATAATDAEVVAAITAHEADTTAVHGIADTTALVLTSDARLRTIRDEGVARVDRAILDFVGAGVTVADDAAGGRTQISIPGGGGGAASVQDQKNALLRPTGAISETFTRLGGLVVGNVTSQTLRLSALLYFLAGQPVASLAALSGPTTPVGLANQWFCVVRFSDRTILAVTADDGGTGWPANTKKSLPIAGGPWTPSVDEWCYFGILENATTPNNFFGNTSTNATPTAEPPMITGNSNSGLTGPLAVGTVVSAIVGTGGFAVYGFAL